MRKKPLIELDQTDIASLIPDGSTIALAASGVFLEADEIYRLLEQSFLATGHPRELTLVHALGIGDGKGTGLGRFAHQGMTRRVIGGHWSWSPAMQQLAADNELAAYSFPAGAISTLLREIGAGRPGLITRIGLGTFADPQVDAGRCNQAATETLVRRIEIDGEVYLHYLPIQIDVAILRGTHMDGRGNVSFHREPADLDARAAALAAHNCGGKVLVQVASRSAEREQAARLVSLPGIMVDAVLTAPGARGTYLPGYDPSLSGEAPPDPVHPQQLQLPVGVRRAIAVRAAREIGDAGSVNFGFGIPGGIPALLKAEGGDTYWGSVEQGLHNGAMLDGPMFGSARDPDAIIPSVDQFDFYGGGGIDIAFLGMGEMDAAGNVNVSVIGGRLVGPGGFIDITQTARKVVFCGTFEAGGADIHIDDQGVVRIRQHGGVPKLVREVAHISFSGAQARVLGQEVIYVTERAVFRLGDEGVELVELAPGVDLQADVLARMEFAPQLAQSLKRPPDA